MCALNCNYTKVQYCLLVVILQCVDSIYRTICLKFKCLCVCVILFVVDGEYKQKSATQTPSGHLSTTSEAEISCKPSDDRGMYQSSKVSEFTIFANTEGVVNFKRNLLRIFLLLSEFI